MEYGDAEQSVKLQSSVRMIDWEARDLRSENLYFKRSNDSLPLFINASMEYSEKFSALPASHKWMRIPSLILSHADETIQLQRRFTAGPLNTHRCLGTSLLSVLKLRWIQNTVGIIPTGVSVDLQRGPWSQDHALLTPTRYFSSHRFSSLWNVLMTALLSVPLRPFPSGSICTSLLVSLDQVAVRLAITKIMSIRLTYVKVKSERSRSPSLRSMLSKMIRRVLLVIITGRNSCTRTMVWQGNSADIHTWICVFDRAAWKDQKNLFR